MLYSRILAWKCQLKQTSNSTICAQIFPHQYFFLTSVIWRAIWTRTESQNCCVCLSPGQSSDRLWLRHLSSQANTQQRLRQILQCHQKGSFYLVEKVFTVLPQFCCGRHQINYVKKSVNLLCFFLSYSPSCWEHMLFSGCTLSVCVCVTGSRVL